MSTQIWPPSRACEQCSESFFPKTTVQKFCSAKCRERAKYDRMRQDPERWSDYLARLRDAYEPKGKPPGPAPTRVGCSVDGCDEKHLAKGFCRKHYRRDRYRQGFGRRTETQVVSALVKHYDESGEFVENPTDRRLIAKVGGVLVPECPDCGGPMMRVPADNEMDLRDCGRCRVRALLNAEEVSWLTSEALSTAQQKRTKNS